MIDVSSALTQLSPRRLQITFSIQQCTHLDSCTINGNCVSDVKKWTIRNELRLNESETEAVFCDPSKSSHPPDVLRIGQSDIPLAILPVT